MRTTNIFFDAIKDGPNEVEKTKQATKTAAGSVDRLPSTTVHEKEIVHFGRILAITCEEIVCRK